MQCQNFPANGPGKYYGNMKVVCPWRLDYCLQYLSLQSQIIDGTYEFSAVPHQNNCMSRIPDIPAETERTMSFHSGANKGGLVLLCHII